MANTVMIPMPGGMVWAPLTTGSGRVTVSDSCYYCKASATPDPTLYGHRIDSDDPFDFLLAAGETLYLKAPDAFRATYTPGAFALLGGDPWWVAMQTGNKAVVVQNYIEANVKRGLQFYLRHLFPAVAVGATASLKFQTGAKPIVIKSREVTFNGSSRIDYQAVEGGTYTGGTAIVVGNENLINPVATTVIAAHSGTPAGGSSFRDKTIFGAGATTGGGSRLGTDVLGRETILKPNTLYQVKLTNVAGAAADIQFEFSWYEGATDL